MNPVIPTANGSAPLPAGRIPGCPRPAPVSSHREEGICNRIDQKSARPDTSPQVSGQEQTTVNSIMTTWGEAEPMTARYLDSELRNQLVAKREADLRTEAERERERLRRQWATQESPTLLSRMAPAILAPANGTGVLPHTIVPIKLTPPPPWSTTEVDIITGKPIQKPVPVSNYALRLERRDPADNWAAPPHSGCRHHTNTFAGRLHGLGCRSPGWESVAVPRLSRNLARECPRCSGYTIGLE